MMNRSQQTPTQAYLYHQQSILAKNSVIKNTYLLLSLTLLFSALTASISFSMNAPMINPFVCIAVYIGLLFGVNLLKDSALGLVAIFALTGFLGYTLGPMINIYTHVYTNGTELVMHAMGLTGIIFLSLSGYALTTKKDFSYMAGFLFVGIIVLFVASLAGLFFNIPAFHLAVSCGFVLLMSGYILYETSAIIHGGQQNYILATLSLYISIYNLFISLLHILAALTGRRE